ncbi:flavin-containing monooxygenase [Marinobacter profundi]|uniref:4-hydroxyacetophenone monooxygenase n=1 Tax=Marinobacter profundi TaxID=2666256 RepID=A0A2G1UQV7_9GAMM|nr:NAD(P)/FAD-dependent oxidoreductase [Marinobacter profundi]PHQ16878.1 4-hydroxyacetophenone monooxygenase [Marinobacter profundi]
MTNSGAASRNILIIGTGFGGLCMAIQLKLAGIHSFTMLEKAPGVGGTWRDNTYPGAACDVQSHLYSFSFEPRHNWSRKFGLQKEILDYMEHCVEKYGLGEHIRFNQEVTAATYDQAAGQWQVETASGGRYDADVLITATGQLNQPAYPDIPGTDRFRGHIFHSARWDHRYDLSGKSVAVIGTGASAIQFVPEIVPKVSKLALFQRSASWVLPKPDRPFKVWEQSLFRSLPAWDRLYRSMIYWKNESRALAFTRFSGLLELFAIQARREARKRVKNPEKRRLLIPDYKIGCKRILISNDWYTAVDQPHVDLVTQPIDHIEEDAVVTRDGHRYPVDAIIYGTGFRATEFLAPMTITGSGGIGLNEAWRKGAEAYKGISVSGFPNLFILYGPNTNLAHNSIVFMLESQVHYVMDCLRELLQRPGTAMDVKNDIQAAFSTRIQQGLEGSVWDSGCTSWYLDKNGKNTVNWPGFTFSYRLKTRHVEASDYHFIPLVTAG